MILPGVIIEGRHAEQRCDGASADGSQLGQIRNEHRGGDRPDSLELAAFVAGLA